MEIKMIDLFKKEIIWSIITFVFVIIYLFGNEGGRCVAFIILAIYAAGGLTDYFIGDNEDDILDCTSYSIVDDVYSDDDESMIGD